MKKELSQMGIPIIGSHANYLFFYSPAEGLPHLLKNEGILIRSCDNYIGLEPGYCRVAIKTHPENKKTVGCNVEIVKRREPVMAKAIMIQGVASGAGKSLIAAGLCRVFHQDGYLTAPFKSQNMALNSFITSDGLEMGRAQVMQAEAAGIEPSALMNPILLKPTGDMESQVIVNGRVFGTMPAREYYKRKKELISEVEKAYTELDGKMERIVLEGAGSPAEINLKKDDFVNMGMAKLAKAPVLLVGDIDRGGVFASLYGTVSLLEPEERKLVRGLIINKFRGDPALLKPGLKQLETLTGIPVVGVLPYLDVDLEDEDSLAPRLENKKQVGILDIAVVRLPHISNFTDFYILEQAEGVGVRYVSRPEDLGNPDLVILPGTKNTMGDLFWLRQNGMETAVKQLAGKQTPLIGICGGYQMLGISLSDPEGVEGGGEAAGMNLLPVKTIFGRKKPVQGRRLRSRQSLVLLQNCPENAWKDTKFIWGRPFGRAEVIFHVWKTAELTVRFALMYWGAICTGCLTAVSLPVRCLSCF